MKVSPGRRYSNASASPFRSAFDPVILSTNHLSQPASLSASIWSASERVLESAAVAQRQIEQAGRIFLWIRMLSSQETLLNALCDLVTNAPELRHTTIERSFLQA
jgi:hypothetical protein